MADQKQGGPKPKARKTVRKTSAPYALEADTGEGEGDGGEAPAEETPEAAADGAAGAEQPAPEVDAPERPQAQKEDLEPQAAQPEPQAAEPEPRAAEPEPTSAFATLIAPQDIVPGDPEADAPPPGPAPPGDSRSFRRRSGGVEEFCLIYRRDNFLITRSGVVGKNGTWSVVEYPSQGAAAHAYAQECSELAGRGFYDLPR